MPGNLGRDNGQGRYRCNLQACAKRKSLRNRGSDTHANKRARPVAERDAIEIGQAKLGVGQHRSNHWHEQARMCAGLLFMSREYLLTVLHGNCARYRRCIERQKLHATAPAAS